jgi:pimeloyl-ACP methyl ester carboxylesterase
MDRAASMARVVRALSGLHVVRYDRRGYGRSTTADPADLRRHVDDLLGVVGDRRATVFGHSYGGVVALTAAQQHPERVGAVVAYEAPMPWRPWWPEGTAGDSAVSTAEGGGNPGDAAEAFLRRMLGDGRWENLPERVRIERRAEGAALVAEIDSLRRAAAPYDAGAVAVPVVAVRGTRSPRHLMQAADVLADEVPGARLEVIDGASHGGHLTHPDEVAAVVRAAVASAGDG